MAPKEKATKKKTPPPAPMAKGPEKVVKEPTGPIWEKKPKNFAIGGDIQVHVASARGGLPAEQPPSLRPAGACCIYSVR